MNIFWTKHAEERQQQWQQRLGISREEVEAVVKVPQQIVIEDDIYVAQSKRGKGLLRVPFAAVGETRRIITLYWTNQVNRYWQDNQHEG
ncbi:DUF4258 domain-containing protein [Nodosilinea sp. LEGE 07088]|uniref:DUF4258 domain-containing protein n=1 Tax=Nodosilinea sp. LEGE 07088 TaxID=2777968 RepID=UPI001881665A|nr:DUF4258 domain-containing protein [Nodosilinea sp. LEGE 07088]MBE9139416.1 DUF4258 domain-containing protein [Nodosilinea sp. LEGE 07088]